MTHDKYVELRGAIIAGNGVEALESESKPASETKCECPARKALLDVLVLFERWRDGIFKQTGVAWESDPPAVVAARKTLSAPCSCAGLRTDLNDCRQRLTHAEY